MFKFILCWKNKSCNKCLGQTNAYLKHVSGLDPQTHWENVCLVDELLHGHQWTGILTQENHRWK